MYRKGAYPTSKINKIFKHLYYQQQNLNDHEPETRSHLLPIRYSDLIQQLLNNNISLIMKLANKVYCHLVTWNTSISSICNSRTKLKQKTSFSYLWRRWHAANMVATTPDFPNSRRSLIFEPSSCQISSIYSNIQSGPMKVYTLKEHKFVKFTGNSNNKHNSWPMWLYVRNVYFKFFKGHVIIK